MGFFSPYTSPTSRLPECGHTATRLLRPTQVRRYGKVSNSAGPHDRLRTHPLTGDSVSLIERRCRFLLTLSYPVSWLALTKQHTVLGKLHTYAYVCHPYVIHILCVYCTFVALWVHSSVLAFATVNVRRLHTYVGETSVIFFETTYVRT